MSIARFVRTLLDDRALLVKVKLSPLFTHPGATLFRQLVDLFQVRERGGARVGLREQG